MSEILKNLKDLYYEEEDLELLRNKYDNNIELQNEIKENRTILEKFNNDNNKSFLYICPDKEWEFPMVFEIEEPNDLEKKREYTSVIYNAIKEYYTYSDFYDEVTGISLLEVVMYKIKKKNVPIIRIFNPGKTELLNIQTL